MYWSGTVLLMARSHGIDHRLSSLRITYPGESPELPKGKLQYFLVALIFLAIGVALGARIYWLRPVTFLGKDSWGDYPSRILKTLEAASQSSSYAPDGLEAPIIQLRSSSGATIRFVVIEGSFTDQAILPMLLWKKYLRDQQYVLVNSVDEKQDTYVKPTSIAGHIGKGCDLDRYVGELLNLGQVKPHPCNSGQYAQLFGQGEVANAAIVLVDATNPDRPPCWKEPNEAQYRDCINEAVNDALLNIFGPNHKSELDAPVMVMPALGTGFGKLSKDDFYKSLFTSLGNLMADRRANLELLVLVDRQSNDWKATEEAIANRLGALAASWRSNSSNGSSADAWFMCGISVVLSIVFLVLGLRAEPQSVASSSLLLSLSPVTLAIGWFSAAAGVMTIAKQAVTLMFPSLPGPLYVIAGLFAPFVCLPILKAVDAVREANRPGRN